MASGKKKGRRKKKLSPIRKIKRYIRRERRKDEIRKERYTPLQYALYLKKKRKRNLIVAGVLAAILLLFILLIVGIVHLVGWIAGGSSKKTITKEQVAVETTDKEDTTEEATEEKEPVVEKKTYEEKDITLGSTGSMFLHDAVLDSVLQDDGTYDFSECFKYIAAYFQSVDFMTCEFEGSLAGEENGYSGYPLFNAPDSVVQAISDSGIDMVLLASNHIYDWTSDGFHRMMSVLDEYGMQYGGVRESTDVPRYRVEDINGIKVGFVDYVFEDEDEAEGTHVVNYNQISDEDVDLINTFSYDHLDDFYAEMADNIAGMKADGAQFIVTEMHWGEEYELVETTRQEEIAQQLADLGVNAIIGGHPHVEEPMDVVEASDGSKMFVIYAQGNLLCNQRKELMDAMPDGHTEDCVMMTLNLHQDTEGNVTLTGVYMIPLWCCKYIDGDGNTHFYILPLDDVENIESTTGLSGIASDALDSYNRTMAEQESGLEKVKAAFTSNN